MRFVVVVIFALWAVPSVWFSSGCYDRPRIPSDKPVTCKPDLKDECPPELACVGGHCVATSCQLDDPNACPLGYVCSPGGFLAPASCQVSGAPAPDAGGQS